MNIAYFLLPKVSVAYLYEDFTFRQGLEKMRRNGYTAIPVITRKGQYVGTVSEGDFLWHLLDDRMALRAGFQTNLERLRIRDILQVDTYRPVRITVSMEELMNSAMNQNFVPVVDDTDHFIGIITRKDILRYFAYGKEQEEPLAKIV
ncbi:MAG: CBS domain-containing protein [Oscillospiraceae bacterium]|nr:CBS domain-containing protein [Oscillospiraceae bacterium]